MKTATFLAIGFCLFAGNVRSQAPEVTGTVLSNLQAIEGANKALLEKQQKTLDLLNELQDNAKQLKFFAHRA